MFRSRTDGSLYSTQWVFSVDWHYKRKGLRCLYHECTLDSSKWGVSFSFQNFQSRTHAYYMWFASICVLVNSNACHRTGEEHGTSATWGALSLDIILEHPQLKFKLFFFFWKHAVCCTILYNYRSWSGVGNSLLFGVSHTIIFMCLN